MGHLPCSQTVFGYIHALQQQELLNLSSIAKVWIAQTVKLGSGW